MTHQQLSADCRAASGALLAALDANDISGIAKVLGLIRRLMERRAELSSEHLSGPELFECERLEAMDAVTSRIEEGLRSLHQTVHDEIDEIQSLKPLLRHLASPACRPPHQMVAGLSVQ
jgi:hypothetical protein